MANLFDRASKDVKEITAGNPPTRIAAFYPNVTVVTVDATAGALDPTTADAILGGLMARDPAGAGRADKFPTAAVIIAAMSGVVDAGRSFMFSIVNTADANETITVTTNTGLTLVGKLTIAQNESGTFLARVTSPTTVSIYRIA